MKFQIPTLTGALKLNQRTEFLLPHRTNLVAVLGLISFIHLFILHNGDFISSDLF